MSDRRSLRIHPPLIELTIARLKEFIRETEAIFWVFGFPLLLTLGLGFAFRQKPPDKIPIGIVDGPAAHRRFEVLSASPALQPRIYPEREGREQLRRGKISLLIEGGTVPAYRFDPTRPDSRAARVEADDALQHGSGRRDAFTARDEHMHEQGSRYIDFLVPGLLGMNLMGTGMWGMAFPIVNGRVKKLLKRLIATPMRRSDYLIAQFLSRLVFLVVEVMTVVVFAWLVFGVRINGSIFAFSVVCVVGGSAFAALGLLVASRATTIEAVSGLTNLIMMPMWLCSGVFFSYERFPDAVQPLIRALPLTALNDALRAVMNDGYGLTQIAAQLASLIGWTAGAYFVGLKIFRWQ